MGTQYDALTDDDRAFIGEQKVFFVASCSGREVNLSPKGYDSLRVVDDKTVVYLDYPGSGDRTARDIAAGGKVTLMFTSFTAKPRITRLFVAGEPVEKDDPRFADLFARFGDVDAAAVRRLILYRVAAVERSCGESVPFMEYVGERDALREWAAKKAADGTLQGYIDDHAAPPILPGV
jgi:hypothetical protein